MNSSNESAKNERKGIQGPKEKRVNASYCLQDAMLEKDCSKGATARLERNKTHQARSGHDSIRLAVVVRGADATMRISAMVTFA